MDIVYCLTSAIKAAAASGTAAAKRFTYFRISAAILHRRRAALEYKRNQIDGIGDIALPITVGVSHAQQVRFRTALENIVYDIHGVAYVYRLVPVRIAAG